MSSMTSASALGGSFDGDIHRNGDPDPLVSGNFRSVLPHEPFSLLQTSATASTTKIEKSTDDSSLSKVPAIVDTTKGYVHLQGAFEPKLKSKSKMNDNHNTSEDSKEEKGQRKQQEHLPHYWTDKEELEYTLLSVLNNKTPKLGSPLPHPIERVHVVLASSPSSTTKSTAKESNQQQEQQRQPFHKARLQFSSINQAMDFQTAWRRYKFSPLDLFGQFISGGGGGDDDLNNNRQQQQQARERHQQLYKDYTISFGSHPCLATVVTPQPLTLQSSSVDDGSSTGRKWTRSNPPKFRRLLHDHDDAKERSQTRFVYISGLFDTDSWNAYCQYHNTSGSSNETSSSSSSFLQTICYDNPQRMMEAIRGILKSDDIEVFLPQPQGPKSSKKNKKNASVAETSISSSLESSSTAQASPFLPPPPFPFCHVGMKNAEDAQRIVRDFQGVIVDDWESGMNDKSEEKPSLSSGPLFLDYVTISNKSKAKHKAKRGKLEGGSKKNDGGWFERGEPSRPECTSTTDNVHVPGLVMIEDFVTEEQEEALMAVLTGPHAPWAPEQLNKSQTGVVKRKVQHYGYVFDYQTADVLRDRYQVQCEDSDGRKNDDHHNSVRIANCPPLPILPREDDDDKNQMSSHLVEERINNAVQQGQGWEVLAGIIEKARRHEFHVEDSEPSTSLPMTFDEINQLTVNQYKPGEGIGSHTDTISAFGDGLISISLNSGIVMEFRNPKVDLAVKKLVYLSRRSLLLMSGPARFEWEHQIVTRQTDTHQGEVFPRGLRVSLTLRTALALDGTPMPRVESSILPPSFATNDSTDRHIEMKSSSNALVTPNVEKDHVHRLYDAIATQWHHTRGKRGVLWPGATQFLQNLKPGSVVADVGCGDGKYFPAIWEAGSYVIGTDISRPLLVTALTASKDVNAKVPESRQVSDQYKSLEDRPAVAVGDCMSVPLRTNSCDAAICIAVMHHLSTLERRVRCIEELVRVVKPGGQINIQAWAMEQKKDSKRKFASTDVFVPFNAQPKYLVKTTNNSEDLASAEMDEHSSAAHQRQSQGKTAAEIYAEKYRNAEFDDKKGLVVFQRYCHMYRAGELESIVETMVDGAKVVDSGYEQGNHFVILEVLL
mmetsp:Transcript_42865/g.103555  ORF Transcript_42865/g.103555 Transcript_42865/m.103555 type:complete len:1111 (+) Transcript_42865:309-3641(+)